MPAEVDPTCTDVEDLTERLTFRVLCRREFLNDLAMSCEEINVGDLAFCAVDENGNYCSQSSDIYSANFTASNNCANTSVCDPLCIEALTNLTTMFGCCFISELNSTSNGRSPGSYLSYEFWEMCGLTSPGFCNVRIDDSPTRVSGNTSTTRCDNTTTTAAATMCSTDDIVGKNWYQWLAIILEGPRLLQNWGRCLGERGAPKWELRRTGR